MIPILYEPSETEFKTNGFGKLSSAVECKVTEEKNGAFDLTMKYPTGGAHYENLAEGCIIVSSHDDSGKLQPFRIIGIKREMRYATITARHDAQVQLSKLPVWPYYMLIGEISIDGVMDYLTALSSRWAENYPAAKITFESKISKKVRYTKELPRFALPFLVGQEGSVIDLLKGGELAYNWYTVKLMYARGESKLVRISYGRNISEITGETAMGECYTGAFIYYIKNGAIKYAKDYHFDTENSIAQYLPNLYELDISSEFQAEPETEEAFLAVANERAAAMEERRPWTNIYQNISVSWYELSQLSEYSHLPKQHIGLCDYVTVDYPAYGIKKEVEIVKTVWNPLKERYESLELNNIKKPLHSTLTSMIQKQIRRT